MTQERVEVQWIPVKVYRSTDRLTIATPMPGLEPEDVSIDVSAEGIITLAGELRGALKGEKELMLNEWNVGSYRRELELPVGVDAELGNATYSNGVLVVALPLANQTRPGRLTLESVGHARGERVGNTGHPVQPRTTEEHRAAMAAAQAPHGRDARGNPNA